MMEVYFYLKPMKMNELPKYFAQKYNFKQV